ncbi:MAG: flagellar hook-length control protein FliK [Oscillospiraceae bacterium]|jgi:hypothetical protein|nr:flagellar hook-length control protein FliK [Oscillospiraceae bacterium]
MVIEMNTLNPIGAAPHNAGGRVSAFGLPATLGEGDRLEARVLSAGGGGAVLKTGDGRIFHAKLEGGASLSPGENVELLVEDRTDGVITLSVIRENTGRSGRPAPAQADLSTETLATGARAGAPSLADVAARLEALGIPANETLTVNIMELIRANPDITPDEAIFMAAQNIAYTPEASNASRLLLSGDGRLDKMLERLRTAILEAEPAGGLRAVVVEGDELRLTAAVAAASANEETPPGRPPSASAGATAPSAPDEPARSAAESADAGGNSAAVPKTETAARQAAPGVPDTPNAAAQPDASGRPGEAALIDGAYRADGGAYRADGAARDDGTVGEAESAGAGDSPRTASSGTRAAPPEGGVARGGIGENLPGARKAETAGAETAPGNIRASSPPDAARTDSTRGQTSADTVNIRADVAPQNVAPDRRSPPEGARASVDEFIESLFVKIGLEESDKLAGRLKAAISELPERLARLAESASRAGAPGVGAAAAETADSIARQSRVMGAAEQYVYAQIPVVVSGEKRSVELYVFKRKRSPISPDDANILLALDLPALGHWEALINVRGRDVSLQMRASGEEAREHLSGNTTRLHAILSEAGYRLTGARVTTGREENATPLTALSRARTAAGIDVVV